MRAKSQLPRVRTVLVYVPAASWECRDHGVDSPAGTPREGRPSPQLVKPSLFFLTSSSAVTFPRSVRQVALWPVGDQFHEFLFGLLEVVVRRCYHSTVSLGMLSAARCPLVFFFLSADKHFKVIFNNIEHSILSAKNIDFSVHVSREDVIKAAGNTELCEIVDVDPKAQCRACLTYWDDGIVYCTCGHFSDRTGKPVKCEMTQQRTRSTSSPFLISSLSRTFTSGRADHTVTGTGRKKVIKNTSREQEVHCKSSQKRSA